MPRYYEDKPEGGACAGLKEDLGACLLQSDCVLQVARPGARLTDTRSGEAGPAEGSRPAAVMVKRSASDFAVLGVERSSNLVNLGESTVRASLPSGVKLERTVPPRWVFVKVINHFGSRNTECCHSARF